METPDLAQAGTGGWGGKPLGGRFIYSFWLSFHVLCVETRRQAWEARGQARVTRRRAWEARRQTSPWSGGVSYTLLFLAASSPQGIPPFLPSDPRGNAPTEEKGSTCQTPRCRSEEQCIGLPTSGILRQAQSPWLHIPRCAMAHVRWLLCDCTPLPQPRAR